MTTPASRSGGGASRRRISRRRLVRDGRSALSLLSTLRPDVVVLDVQRTDIDGFEVIEQLGDDPPAVVLVSSRGAADYGARVARSGAVGFISKADLSAASLAEAVAGR